MKKMLAALALALTLPTCALGDSEGVIVQSSCNIVQSGDYYLAYCFAQVHNNASTVICLDQGTFDLQSGETLLSTSEVSQIWPYFLSPGEDGYLFDIVSFEPDENGNPVIPSITGISYNVTYLPVDNAYASYDLSAVSEIAQDVSGDVSVVCRLTNSTDMDAYNPTGQYERIVPQGRGLTRLSLYKCHFSWLAQRDMRWEIQEPQVPGRVWDSVPSVPHRKTKQEGFGEWKKRQFVPARRLCLRA